MTYGYLNQLPGLNPSVYGIAAAWICTEEPLRDWLLLRVLEPTYTAWDLAPFAREVGWDEERRFLLCCELDAAFFHLYLPTTPDGRWRPARTSDGAVRDETVEELAELERHFPFPRDAVAYIMDTFPIVRRKDEEKHGEYRTQRVILEIYDAMQEAMRANRPYQSRLDPPPADPRCCHPAG